MCCNIYAAIIMQMHKVLERLFALVRSPFSLHTMPTEEQLGCMHNKKPPTTGQAGLLNQIQYPWDQQGSAEILSAGSLQNMKHSKTHKHIEDQRGKGKSKLQPSHYEHQSRVSQFEQLGWGRAHPPKRCSSLQHPNTTNRQRANFTLKKNKTKQLHAFLWQKILSNTFCNIKGSRCTNQDPL